MDALALTGLFIGAVSLLGGVAMLFVWIVDRRDARIDADHRAARLVAQARAEVARG